jgi:hypothetical protein
MQLPYFTADKNNILILQSSLPIVNEGNGLKRLGGLASWLALAACNDYMHQSTGFSHKP